jgi:hypothetical protein
MKVWSARISEPSVWIRTVKYFLRTVVLLLVTDTVNGAILFTVVEQTTKRVPLLWTWVSQPPPLPPPPPPYICTFLTITRITTVTQVRPTYFGIGVSMIKYINSWILTKFTERIRVIMQLFMDLFAVQCMPTGRCHWDISTEKNVCRPFGRPITKFTRVLKWTVSWHHCREKGLNDTTDTVWLPQTDSRLSIMFIKHVADWVQHRTRVWNLMWWAQSDIGPQRVNMTLYYISMDASNEKYN